MSRNDIRQWREKWEQNAATHAKDFNYSMYMYAIGQVDATDLILEEYGRVAAVTRIPYDHKADFARKGAV